MDVLQTGMILLAALLVLLVGGVWIAISLAIVGWIGMQAFTSSPPGFNLITAFWQSSASWELAALPLFVWMGEILFRTRLSNQMFTGLAPWLGWLPGRLMHVNILGSGIFGSISGSSAATCATVAKIALPELRRRGYDERVCLGSLAGAGTLGLLFPPSIVMIVYAVAAEVSIIKIFLAGFLPGLLVMTLFSGYIAIWSLRHPDRVPANEIRMSLVEKLWASRELIPCILLIVGVVAVIVMGWATATEAAAFGVVGSLLLAGLTGALSWRSLYDSLLGAARLSCMIMFILAGAAFLTLTMGFTEIPRAIAEWVVALNPDRYLLIAILSVMYILLGTALDGISMIVLTTSIVLPMIDRLGIDLIWFGIFVVLLVEIAEVTPPVGFGLFVLQTMSGRDSTFVARAAIPFFSMLVVAIAIITVFPSIVTIVPDLVMGR
jgi:tripartite ATP-independent transporter DctM subunit